MNNNTAHLNDAEARKLAKNSRRPDRELEEEIQHQLEDEELLEIGDDESPIEQEEEWRRYLEDANNDGVETVIRPMTDEEFNRVEEIREMSNEELCIDMDEIEASTCTGGPTGDIVADLCTLARRQTLEKAIAESDARIEAIQAQIERTKAETAEAVAKIEEEIAKEEKEMNEKLEREAAEYYQDIEDRETSNPFYVAHAVFNSVVIPGVPTLEQVCLADEKGFDGHDLYWKDGVEMRKLALNEALRNLDRSFRLDNGYRMVALKPREVFRTANNAEELLFRKGVISLPAVRELAIQFGRAMAHARYSGWHFIEAEAPAIVGIEKFYAMEDRKGRRVAAVMTRKDNKQRFFVMDWDAKRGQWRAHKIGRRIENMLRHDGAPNAPAFSKYHMLAAALNRMPVGFEGIGERFDEFVGYVNDGFYRELWRLAGYAYSDFPEIDNKLADQFLDSTIEPLDVQDAVEWGDAAYGWAQEIEQERVEQAEMRYTEQVWEAARIQAECELASLEGEDGYADMLRERTDELVKELS